MPDVAINAAGLHSPPRDVAVDSGFQGGERVLPVGRGNRIRQRSSFSRGGAFSGSERSAGIGFGLDP